MLLIIIGGDLRYAHLTSQAVSQSMDVAAVGLEKSPFPLPRASLSDISEAQALLLPNPWRTGLVLPLSESAFTLNDVLARASPDALLLLSDTAFMPSPPPVQPCIDLSQNEGFVLGNAYLTAEAALFTAYRKSGRSFLNARCLVIGYGRIGERLTRLLLSMGADVAVAARSESARTRAGNAGASAFPMEDLRFLLPRSGCIFSTVPATVLNEPLLRQITPDALLMDLASPPYGFDLETAIALSLCVSRENGLPGRCCPESAAALLLDAVKSALAGAKKGVLPCI